MLPLRKYPVLLKASSWFLLMFVIYGIHLFLFRPSYTTTTYEYAEFYINSFGPVFIFYKFSKDGLLTENRMKVYFIFLFLVVIWRYCHNITSSIKDEFTNNTGYELVSLLPLTWLFHKQHLLRYSLWAIFMLLILLSMKRGAILIGGICFIWMLYESIMHSTSKKSRYIAVLFGAVLTIGATSLVLNLLENSTYFQNRVEATQDGKSSGRDEIYSMLIEHMIESKSYADLLIGRGANSTLELKRMAHQDWLQVAYDNGLIGICLFLNFCGAFLYTAINSRCRISRNLSTSFLMLFFIFFMKTLFSMSLTVISIGMSMLMGYYTFKTNEYSSYVIDK